MVGTQLKYSIQATADYVIIVMGKYLQMQVAYSIYKEDLERVTDHFERFNREFEQVCEVFKEVTQQDFRPGQEVKKSTKPLAQVKPIPREPILTVRQYSLSDQEQLELKQFLESYQLDEQLLQILLEEGAALADLFQMTEEDRTRTRWLGPICSSSS